MKIDMASKEVFKSEQSKTDFAQLVNLLRYGQDIVIVSNGEPVAKLVAYRRAPAVMTAGAIAGAGGHFDETAPHDLGVGCPRLFDGEE